MTHFYTEHNHRGHLCEQRIIICTFNTDNPYRGIALYINQETEEWSFMGERTGPNGLGIMRPYSQQRQECAERKLNPHILGIFFKLLYAAPTCWLTYLLTCYSHLENISWKIFSRKRMLIVYIHVDKNRGTVPFLVFKATFKRGGNDV